MTDPWVAFVRARLAEWEAMAQQDKSAPAGTMRFVDSDSWSEPLLMEFSADSVLGMVGALREVLATLLRNAEDADGEWGDGHTAAQLEAGECDDQAGELEGVRHMATIWSDHPDYPGREAAAPVAQGQHGGRS